MFILQCTPSQKFAVYHVEIVFDCMDETNQYEVNKSMCYCTCKRGITQLWCSHRIAVFLWLESVQKKFSELKFQNAPKNFRQYAEAMHLPKPLLDIASLPIGPKQLLEQSSIHGCLLRAQKANPRDEEEISRLQCLIAQSDVRLKTALDMYLSDIEYESTNRHSTKRFSQLDASTAICLKEYKVLGFETWLVQHVCAGEGAHTTTGGTELTTTTAKPTTITDPTKQPSKRKSQSLEVGGGLIAKIRR